MTRYQAGLIVAAAMGFGCGGTEPSSDLGTSPEAVTFVCDQTINPCCCYKGKTYLPQTDQNYFQCSMTCQVQNGCTKVRGCP